MEVQLNQENKEPRALSDIQQEFNDICAKAGHLQYLINIHNKDLVIINEQLRDLNLEAAASQAREKAKQQEQANG